MSRDTVLDIINRASIEMGFSPVTAVVTSTDARVRQLLYLLDRLGRELRSEKPWGELTKLGTIQLELGVDSYALPADFDSFSYDTFWNVDQSLRLYGPFEGKEWQAFKWGQLSTTIYQRFRVKGATSKEFFLDPTPGAGEDGQQVAFEYQTKNWLLPPVWTASATVELNKYYSYEDRPYKVTTAGTFSTTAPTHTSGTQSNGSAALQYTDLYQSILNDLDTPVLNGDVLCLGLQYKFKRAKGLPYEDIYADYIDAYKKAYTDKIGATEINLTKSRYSFDPLIKEGNWDI